MNEMKCGVCKEIVLDELTLINNWPPGSQAKWVCKRCLRKLVRVARIPRVSISASSAGVARLLGITQVKLNWIVDSDPTFPAPQFVVDGKPAWTEKVIRNWRDKDYRKTAVALAKFHATKGFLSRTVPTGL